jgi:hypothetical protein
LYLGEGKRAQAEKDVEKLMARDRSHPMLAELMPLVGLDEPAETTQPTLPPPTLPPAARQ